MMFQGKKSSESHSKRCSLGDEGGAEGGDWVWLLRLRRKVARVLV